MGACCGTPPPVVDPEIETKRRNSMKNMINANKPKHVIQKP